MKILRTAIVAIAATPVVVVLGTAVVVQGLIAWRTDFAANVQADQWMQDDFRLWAQELRGVKR